MHSTLAGFTEGTKQPYYSIDFIDSTPIKFMTNTECRRFLKEDTNQYDKEIMCFNTTDLEYYSHFSTVSYRKVASINANYQFKNQHFVKRSQYISMKNPLYKIYKCLHVLETC